MLNLIEYLSKESSPFSLAFLIVILGSIPYLICKHLFFLRYIKKHEKTTLARFLNWICRNELLSLILSIPITMLILVFLVAIMTTIALCGGAIYVT